MSNIKKMISHQYLIIVFLLTYLLTSCTPAKVDFSASQLNNLKYVFTDSNNKTNTVTLHPGDSSVLEFKTSDKISNSLQIKIQYQVVSPENQEVGKILNNFTTSKSIGIGEKTFTLPLEINSTLPFSSDAVMKISLSSEGDSVEITPNEYTLKIVNAIAPVLTPEISFNALTYVNLSNQVTYLISGSCANVTQFSLLVNASAYSVTCVSSLWTKVVDLSGFSDGSLALKVMDTAMTVEYRNTTVIKDTVKPVITAINDSIFYNSTTETPVITWSGSDATSGIQKYEIALGTSGSVQDKFPWTDIGAVLSKQLTGLSLTNGGTYYVQLRATDLAGNVGNVFTGDGYTVNTSMPVATLSGQPTALTNVSTYSITVGGLGIIDYKYKVGSSSSTDCSDPAGYSATAISTSVSIAGSTASADSYKLCVVGENNVNQWQAFSSATSYVWTFDNVLPLVAITSPSVGSFANISNYSNFAVTASCSENGATVNFKAANTADATINTITTGTCSAGNVTATFNLSALQDGGVDIKAWQQDSAGNIGYSGIVNINKDTVAPSISGSLTLSNYSFNSTNSSPLISWGSVILTESGSGFNTYKLAIGTSPGLANVMGLVSLNGNSYTATPLVLTHGTTYFVTLVAMDNAGNYSSALGTSWNVDNVAPAVAITAPALGSFVGNSNQASFTFSVNCETGLQVNFTSTSLVNGAYTSSSAGTCSAGTATTNVDLSNYPNGNIQFTASQTDLAANTGTDTRNILKDTIAPTISGSVSDGTYFNSLTDSPNLSWAGAVDTAGSGVLNYQIRIGTSIGGSEITDWMDIGNVTSYQMHTLSLVEGTIYYPSVRAVDKAGNISTVIYGDGWIPDMGGPTPPSIVNDGDQWTSLTSSPPISWSAASDAASGIAKYEVRLVDFGGNPVSSWIDVGTATTYSFSGLPPLAVLNVYRAQVRATDNAGNIGNFANGDGWKVVDPGWKTESFLKAVNAESLDFFGGSVAIDADTVVVGAYGEDSNQTTITNGPTASSDNSFSASGAAYVYKRTWNNTLKKYDWAQEAYLKAPNANSGDSFGSSVSISNDTIVVGAYGEDSNQTFITNGPTASTDNTATSSGAAYVFKRSGAMWSQEAYLKASNAEAGDSFGSSVAISNDTIVVGAYGEDSNQTSITNGPTASSDNSAQGSGAAYVFKRSGVTWTQEAYLKASNAANGYNFGYPVAISNDTIVVGSNGESSNQMGVTNGPTASSDNSASGSGAAYVFKRSGATWTQEAYLKASNAEAGDQFGFVVAISNDTIVVGAPFEDSNQTFINNGPTASSDNSALNSGAAYVFKRSGATWSQEAYLKAPNAEAGDQFGVAVTISNDTVVVSANLEKSNQTTITNGSTASSDNSLTNSGAAYVFHRQISPIGWSSVAYIKAPNPSAGDVFGKFISISNNTLVIGVPQEDSDINYIQNSADTFIHNDNATDPGAAYIFKFDP